MHARLEVIMPKTDDVEGVLTELLSPFSENAEGDEARGDQFFDWWVIGGRFAGAKLEASLDPMKIQSFYDELQNRKVTCSGIQCGKQTLIPSSQAEMVDSLWRDFFPESGISICPLFSHSNDQYDSGDSLPGDICSVSEIPPELTAERVIIAALDWEGEKISAWRMEQKDFWNGCNNVSSDWDGKVFSAIERSNNATQNYTDEAKEKYTVRQDWICVSIDYHN